MSRFGQLLRTIRIPTAGEIVEDLKIWVRTQGPWWLTSVVAHAVILSTSLLLLGSIIPPPPEGEAPSFEAARIDTEIKPEEIKDFEVGDTPIDPTELNTDTLMMTEQAQMAQDEQINGSPDEPFEEAGGGLATATNDLQGMGGFEVRAFGPGPKVAGRGGVGEGRGLGTSPGSGGAGSGFGGRGAGVRREMLGRYGGTKGSERAVAAALNWLARHQSVDGGWSLHEYNRACKDPSCTGRGAAKSDAAATAMALLPFLAAGQTHKTKGPYQKTIAAGLYWLISHQDKGTGNLVAGGEALMYTHGLAAICLCEAYGLSGDKQVGMAAQQAIYFIERAQGKDGGWRYSIGETPGDTSVVGWQVMALKSAQMAGLEVSAQVLQGAESYLKAAAVGKGGTFAYQPGGGPTPAMSAVGLLCKQYQGMQRQDPAMQEGMKYLMGHLPDQAAKNVYYWYYATQVMHNLPGYEWDTWNRKMRKLLIDTQEKKGCAAGSWNPEGHPHADRGGRIMVTSLSCLTLEVYYRYLPLYQLDGKKDTAKKDEAKKEAAK